jgi:hypothetical protein
MICNSFFIDKYYNKLKMVKDGIRKRISLFPPYIRLSMVEVMREKNYI